MFVSFSAEWLKTKRTFFRIILYGSPILFNVMIFGYVMSTKKEVSETNFYFNYYAVLNFLLPSIVCLILAVMNNNEREAGNFKNIFGLNYHYYFLLCLKFIFSYLVVSFVFLINSLLTVVLLKFTLNVDSTAFFGHLMFGFFLTWICFLTSFIIYFFLSIIFSFITTFFIGIFSSLLTIFIGLTPLGNGTWIFFPFTWGIRLVATSASNTSLLNFFYENTYAIYLLLICPLIIFLSLLFFCVSLFRRGQV